MASPLMSTVPCAECDNLAAKFHCDTCGKALCAQCKANHLDNKGTRHHVIVKYAMKLNPKYLSGLLCHTHNTTDPEFWCDTCDAPICMTCITEKHKGHKVSKITAVLSEKRDAMREEMKVLRDNTVGRWQQVLHQAQQITADHLQNIEKIDQNLVSRAKEIHNEVDMILLQARQTLKQMTNSGLGQLKEQEKYLADRVRQLQADVQHYEDKLRDANANALLQFKPGSIQPKEKIPSLSTASAPVFTKGQNHSESIQKMFGKLSTGNISRISSTCGQNSGPADTSDSGITITTIGQSASGINAAQRSLIPNPSVQSKFDVDTIYPHIACVDQGLAWVETMRKKLQLVDRVGSVKDGINTDFDFTDITVTSAGEVLLADYSAKCIRSVRLKRLQHFVNVYTECNKRNATV